jgi:hypothetical protein
MLPATRGAARRIVRSYPFLQAADEILIRVRWQRQPCLVIAGTALQRQKCGGLYLLHFCRIEVVKLDKHGAVGERAHDEVLFLLDGALQHGGQKMSESRRWHLLAIAGLVALAIGPDHVEAFRSRPITRPA